MELCTLEERRARMEVLIRKLIVGHEEERSAELIQTQIVPNIVPSGGLDRLVAIETAK
jgi:hypothetical protein